MEAIHLDAKVKAALDSFDWSNIEERPVNNNLSCSGLLHQIGCDYTSLLVDILTPEPKQPEVQPSVQLPAQPRYSSLKMKQHHQYLMYCEKFKNIDQTVSSHEKVAFKDYKFLHRKVIAEQQEYHEYAFQIALNSIFKYDATTPEAEKYLKHFLTREIKRIQQYMQCYIFHQNLVISVVPYMNDPQPKFENLNITVGQSVTILIPESEIVIPPNEYYSKDDVHLNTISEDENAEKLAASWNADVVTSLSALRTLADNTPPFNKEWEMPMQIKNLKDSSGGFRKVIFIDKALPPKSVNGREKMFRYFKRAVKQFLFDISAPLSDSESEDDDSESEDSDDNSDNDSDNEDDEDDDDEIIADPSSSVPSNVTTSANEKDPIRGAGESDLRIPQLDGIDDRAKAEKTAEPSLPKRKTRLTSVPESVARASNLSVWTHSFKALPKTGLRSQANTSQANKFAGWSTSRKPSSKKPQEAPPPSSSQATDSEEDNLVIDSDDPKDPKNPSKTPIDSSSKQQTSDEETSEPLEITFKATEIPSNILESVIGSDTDQEPSPSDSTEFLPTRRVTRSRSESISDQSESRYNTRSNKLVVKVSPKRKNLTKKSSSKSNVKTRNKRKIDNDEDNSDQSTSKNLKKSKLSESAKSKSLESQKTSPVVIESKIDNKLSKEIHPQTSKTNKPLIGDRVRRASNTKETSEKLSVSSNLVTTPLHSSVHVSSAETSQKKNLRLNSTLTSAGSIPPKVQCISSVTVKSNTLKTKPTAVQSSIETAKKSKVKPEVLKQDNEEASTDVLGQILSMQPVRKDRTANSDTNDLKKGSMTSRCIPSVPTPIESDEMNFDSMLQFHRTKLIDPGKGVFYSLWSLGSYRILIRGCMHGKLPSKPNQTHCENVTIRTKLEYQPDLGYEKLSKSDACAEWLDLQFRPQPSVVLRCRVNPFSSKCFRFEQVRNVKDTYQSYQAAGFSHLTSTKLLYSIFQKLISNNAYCVGCYLVTHKFGANELVTRKSSNGPNSKMVVYDLRREYSNPGRPVQCTPQTIPYYPLDPTKQTAWQALNRRVPMTFELQPKSDVSKNKKGKKKKKKTTEDDE